MIVAGRPKGPPMAAVVECEDGSKKLNNRPLTNCQRKYIALSLSLSLCVCYTPFIRLFHKHASVGRDFIIIIFVRATFHQITLLTCCNENHIILYIYICLPHVGLTEVCRTRKRVAVRVYIIMYFLLCVAVAAIIKRTLVRRLL